MKNLKWVTPKGRDVIPLFLLGEWIEVYPHECLLVHIHHIPELLLAGFKIVPGGPKPAASLKDLKKTLYRSTFTE